MGILLSDEILLSAPNSGKESFSLHIIPKTKGLGESLRMGRGCGFYGSCFTGSEMHAYHMSEPILSSLLKVVMFYLVFVCVTGKAF